MWKHKMTQDSIMVKLANIKAGRTMPIKYSIKVVKDVNPNEPFVRNENLTILIYKKGQPEKILQESNNGPSSKDYRINPEDKHYITNFKKTNNLCCRNMAEGYAFRQF